jgi:hypothetical protein
MAIALEAIAIFINAFVFSILVIGHLSFKYYLSAG